MEVERCGFGAAVSGRGGGHSLRSAGGRCRGPTPAPLHRGPGRPRLRLSIGNPAPGVPRASPAAPLLASQALGACLGSDKQGRGVTVQGGAGALPQRTAVAWAAGGWSENRCVCPLPVVLGWGPAGRTWPVGAPAVSTPAACAPPPTAQVPPTPFWKVPLHNPLTPCIVFSPLVHIFNELLQDCPECMDFKIICPQINF